MGQSCAGRVHDENDGKAQLSEAGSRGLRASLSLCAIIALCQSTLASTATALLSWPSMAVAPVGTSPRWRGPPAAGSSRLISQGTARALC